MQIQNWWSTEDKERMNVLSGITIDKKATAVTNYIEKLKIKKEEKPQGEFSISIQQHIMVCWHMYHCKEVKKVHAGKGLVVIPGYAE